MAKRKGGGHGGHGWFVTFADLMGLLLAFFVVLVASSSQDDKKKNQMAGSFRDAFGTVPHSAMAGIIEVEGSPTRKKLVNSKPVNPDQMSDRPGEMADDDGKGKDSAAAQAARKMAMAAVTLRQAMQALPEITESSKNVLMEERPDGIDIQIVDQDGRAMFPDGGREPYERTRKLLTAIVPMIKQLPNRIQITGHTSARRTPGRPGYGAWDLTADRANAVRMILEEGGMPADRFYAVIGKGETEPMFPDDPYLAANRRVSILLMKEDSVMPATLTP